MRGAERIERVQLEGVKVWVLGRLGWGCESWGTIEGKLRVVMLLGFGKKACHIYGDRGDGLAGVGKGDVCTMKYRFYECGCNGV